MEHHPYFDLLLYTNQELETLLGAQVLERTTIHEWPLSCVQRLTMSDGTNWIYKSESSPTLEPEFYARTRSPLLANHRTVFRDSHYACLLLEYLEAPLLKASSLTEADAVQLGHSLLAEIAEIEGRPPVYLTIGSIENWQAIMDGMIQDLDGLVGTGKFEHTNRDSVRAIAHAAADPDVITIFSSNSSYRPGLVHHDLNADNIFVTGKSFKIIDWQRPIFGPPEIDLVLLLTSLGFDPRREVIPEIVTITDLLRIHWFTECACCWFPEGIKTYDRTIAHIAHQLG